MSLRPPTSGSFKPGNCANPNGSVTVNQAVNDVKKLAREHTADAIEDLAAIMKDPQKPAAARVTAAVALLDRGWGKPAQSVNIEQSKRVIDISVQMTPQEATEAYGEMLRGARLAQPTTMIEGEVESPPMCNQKIRHANRLILLLDAPVEALLG
jgi:hypothetical protein